MSNSDLWKEIIEQWEKNTDNFTLEIFHSFPSMVSCLYNFKSNTCSTVSHSDHALCIFAHMKLIYHLLYTGQALEQQQFPQIIQIIIYDSTCLYAQLILLYCPTRGLSRFCVSPQFNKQTLKFIYFVIDDYVT